MSDQTPVAKIVFPESTETEPRFVEAYAVATRAGDVFQETFQAVGAVPIIPQDNLDLWSARQLTMYLVTLFREVQLASTELAFLEYPRAQRILNRQLVEYYARNRWFIEDKHEATLELTLLEKTVHKEVSRNKDAWKDAVFVERIKQNYLNWAAANPELDALKRSEPGDTELVRRSLDDPDDLFWYYGAPSLTVHGKTHGLQDVLSRTLDGQFEQNAKSLWHNRTTELYRTTEFSLKYAYLLALNFRLSRSSIDTVQRQFAEVLIAAGLTTDFVTVKRYS